MVEDSAAYLDGPGREDSKGLARHVALAYAGESMRLTTRLMQVASWLLVQKAIADEEDLPPYVVFNDASLMEMAEILPTSQGEMLAINGVGHRKLEKYGSVVLGVIEEHLMAGISER